MPIVIHTLFTNSEHWRLISYAHLIVVRLAFCKNISSSFNAVIYVVVNQSILSDHIPVPVYDMIMICILLLKLLNLKMLWKESQQSIAAYIMCCNTI